MKRQFYLPVLLMSTLLFSCKQNKEAKEEAFVYTADQFADIKVIRYQIPGWDSLSLQQKELVYYLSEAALCGRDIIYDQNFNYNLMIRKALENIEATYTGDKNTPEYKEFMVYLKRIWFSNGIHHHYSNEKFTPGFSQQYFNDLFKNSTVQAENPEELLAMISPIIFDPSLFAKRLNLDPAIGLIEGSASNFYQGVTTQEVEDFYSKMIDSQATCPISYGLNSKVVKEKGKIVEKVWKVGGMYSQAIEKIVYWLEKASVVAENEVQKSHLLKLIEYYKTGSLKTWDDYNVLWVSDNQSMVDYVNGFIETYSDPMGMKADWEAVVNFKDIEATKRTEKISANAQWFEDHSPVDTRFKKEEVKGVSAKVITVAQLGGACHPTSPLGINLPNADWIRRDHGSKSVSIENITYAYAKSAEEGSSIIAEYAYDNKEIELNKKYGDIAGNLHTDLHECLGHGSGKLLPNTSSEALKNYSSAMEEARADLFALYYMMDPKMIELGIIPSLDVAKAEYNTAIRNGLLQQLVRIDLGKDIEQAHMRCRSLIAQYAYQKGQAQKVIEKVSKNGKTYFKINDYEKLRIIFGELLAEIQRIKSEGDFEGAKNMVETFGVKIDRNLHKEVKERYSKLKLAPYGGFINPVLTPIEKDGKIVDIIVTYPQDFAEQMKLYSQKYSFLPINN